MRGAFVRLRTVPGALRSALMPACGWLRLTLPAGWLLCCERATVPEVVLLLRVLEPPRTGWPVLGRACVPLTLPVLPVEPVAGRRCWRTVVPLLRVGAVWRLTLPDEGFVGRACVALPLLRVLDPLRETWPEYPPLGRAAEELRLCEDMEGWLLRGVAEPRPLVLPAEPELLIWVDGADIEEEGRLPPLLRELPPPEPPRELLPPLV